MFIGLAWLAVAAAQDKPAKEPLAPMVSVRAVAETWSDVGIGSVYGTGGLFGAAAVVVPIAGGLVLDVEAGYRRLATDDGAEAPDDTFLLELTPLSLVPEWTFRSARAVDGFVGAGLAITAFRERHPPDAEGRGVTAGAKLAPELRAGLRVDTGLVRARMAPTSLIQGVDLELYAARRIRLPGGEGFALDSWRGGVGFGVRW